MIAFHPQTGLSNVSNRANAREEHHTLPDLIRNQTNNNRIICFYALTH